ncbi:MAG: type II toxin-antitoxin system VapC family toxin [Rhodospirillales bacterium]|nr:type II toxin-antitoxin system VapC family toxin [Rhodospirillales bacterium]
MRLLLDSHAVYWWMTGSRRLSASALDLILDDTNAVLVSAVSIYEIELKAGRRRVNLPPQELRAALRRNAVEELAITHDHAEYAAHLDWAHRDPWDRLLAAQALLENCAFISIDRVFDDIPVERRW